LNEVLGGSVVTWGEAAVASRTVVAGVAESSALSSAVVVEDGLPVATMPIGDDTLRVITLGANGRLDLSDIVFVLVPEPEPLPWPTAVVRQSLDLVPAATTVPELDLQIHHVRVRRVQRTIATWWPAPGELRWVELDTSGPVGAIHVVADGPRIGHSPALLQRALREASRP
jgi:hypothetical protein